jgi:3-hydroxyacyl-[acyl-carrier-protein] dehydratase
MPAPRQIIELADFPFEPVVDPEGVRLDREGIRKYNRQRFEWEQLTAITLLDSERRLVAGYRDYEPGEWWTRGHFPERPLVPGVLMLEAAAQCCSIYVSYFKLVKGDELMGFGGVEDVRFRGAVSPGQRMLLMGYAERNSSKLMRVDVQGFVEGQMVFHGRVIGVPLKREAASSS